MPVGRAHRRTPGQRLSPDLVLLIALAGGLALGFAIRSWWALAITVLEPILLVPGSVVGWLAAGGTPQLTAGVLTAIVASAGCACGIHVAQGTFSGPLSR